MRDLFTGIMRFILILLVAVLGAGKTFAETTLPVPNWNFENSDSNTDGKPDYYRVRGSTEAIHFIETNPANVFAGNQCGLFNNTSGVDLTGYFYACYDVDGSNWEPIDVETGCEYELRVKYKTDAGFSGEGINIKLQLMENDDLISQVDSPHCVSSGEWSTLTVRAKVRGRVNKVAGAIYYTGQGKAWVDNFEIVNIKPALCVNGSFERYSAGLPSFFKARTVTSAYHSVETDIAYTYLGNTAALFNNTSGGDAACYYYGPYDEQGVNKDYIPVCPGDLYEIQGFVRVDPQFSGTGVKLSLFFYDESQNFIEAHHSASFDSVQWTKVTKSAIVPADAAFMLYGISYSGKGKAWADEINVEQKNPAINCSFETDNGNNKPSYWKPRSVTSSYHSIDSTTYYSGTSSALFDNNTALEADCYYYGASDSSGDTTFKIPVFPGDVFSVSAMAKVANDFSGDGVKVSIIFWNDLESKGRVDSDFCTSTDWTEINVQATVPSDVTSITYAVKYTGINKAWVDDVNVVKSDSAWYYREAPIDSMEALSFTPPAKTALAQLLDKFDDFHTALEAEFGILEDNSWCSGYGTDPLVRSTANAMTGYTGMYIYNNTALYQTRVLQGVTWLLAEQMLNGAFPWNTDPVTTTGGSLVYETGLGAKALIDAYSIEPDNAKKENYLDASNAACDFLLTQTSYGNANYAGFGMWGLSANYAVTSEADYLEHAIYFADCALAGQLDSGMWMDDHNQYIHYHGIIVKGLADLLTVLESSNSPKASAIRHYLYKSLNHSLRCLKANGRFIYHPIHGGEDYKGLPTNGLVSSYNIISNDPDLSAQDKQNYEDAMDTLTLGALYFDTSGAHFMQGHDFPALVNLLNIYY